MEQMRITRHELRLLARGSERRQARLAEGTQPLRYAAGGGPEVDDDLLARIDAVLAYLPVDQAA